MCGRGPDQGRVQHRPAGSPRSRAEVRDVVFSVAEWAFPAGAAPVWPTADPLFGSCRLRGSPTQHMVEGRHGRRRARIGSPVADPLDEGGSACLCPCRLRGDAVRITGRTVCGELRRCPERPSPSTPLIARHANRVGGMTQRMGSCSVENACPGRNRARRGELLTSGLDNRWVLLSSVSGLVCYPARTSLGDPSV